MTFTFTDYSDAYFGVVLKRTIPPVRSGKFVQITDGQAEHIVLSPREMSKFHANIVERFCQLGGIRGAYDARREHFSIFDPSWSVTGGGKWEMDETAKVLKLHGSSQAYGGFDPVGLDEKIRSDARMAGFAILVGGR